MGNLNLVQMINGKPMVSSLDNTVVIVTAVISVLFTLAFYALRSIGIFCMAKRAGQKYSLFAFIPLLWIYLACKLIGKVKIFGKSFNYWALWIVIVFSVSEILTVAYNFIVWYPYVMYYLQGGTLSIVSAEDGTYIQTGKDFISSFPTANWTFMRVINGVSGIIGIVSSVASIFVYIYLFRAYWPQQYILISVLSVLGLFPVFVFVIRNKDQIDFKDYVRSMYGRYNSPYNNPGPNQARPPEHPFSEFAERGEVDPGDPFSEFSDGKKSGNNEPFSEFDDQDKKN